MDWIELYWPYLLIALFALLAFVVVLRIATRRRVEIAPPTLDSAPPSPTLIKAPRAEPGERPTVSLPIDGDDLSTMKGVGPRLITKLQSLGVTRFEQIAAWSDDDLARIDSQLGSFAGRATRDQWVDQARLLASGDRDGYEARFGKLGSG